MQTPGSPDIAVLQVDVIFDISGTNPQVLLTNLSSGPNLSACSWFFKVVSPTQTVIYETTSTDPSIVGDFTSFTISSNWPRPFNQIEWGTYQFIAGVIDGDGNVYTDAAQEVNICRPPGNTPLSKNTYGLATCYVQVNCAEAGVFFQDTTNHTYKGLEGTIGSSILRVIYPIDETGTIPTPFVADHFTAVQVPITYSSDNYQFMATSIYDYDFDNYTHVRIKYQSFNPRNGSPAVTFKVLCNIDLCPLVCEYEKFIDKLEAGNCADAEQAHQDLVLMNSKMALIMIGIKEPLCGLDVPALIEEVKAIGGFTCDCCNAATGIIPTSTSIIDGYTFQIVPVCGDINGTVTTNGNLIQFNLQDKSYVFKICDASPAMTTAFTVTPSTQGCVKTYCLNIDVTQLSEDILNTVKDNIDLVNLFNSIVISQGGNFTLLVDGGCIFSSGAACDYTFTLQNIPATTTFAQLKYLVIPGLGGGVGVDKLPVNYAFNLTNLPGLQAALNALGYGTFVVTNSGGGVVTITSTANTTTISNMAYSITSTTLFAGISKDCTGFSPISANEAVQLLIDYICGLDDTQVVTSADYEICYIDPDDGVSKTATVAAGSALTTFITELLARGCQTIEYVISLVPQDCDGMKTLFPASTDLMDNNDYFFGTKAGKCARILPLEAFLQMLTLGAYNQDIINAFCAMLQLCRGEVVCQPYTNFGVSTSPFDQDCVTVVKYGLSGNTPLTVNAVSFANAPTTAQTIFVEYKLTTDTAWTAGGSSLTDTGSTLGTLVTPVALSLTTPGLFYNIRVYNGCQSPPDYIDNGGASFEAGTLP